MDSTNNFIDIKSAEHGDVPLRCVHGNLGDVFSGWFAISDPNQCTDFCFWSYNFLSNTSEIADLTADPHQMTKIGESKWGCMYGLSNDNDAFFNFREFDDDPGSFHYPKCSRGMGEVLETPSQRLFTSRTFWSLITVGCVMIWYLQLHFYVRKRFKQKKKSEESRKTYSSDEFRHGALDPLSLPIPEDYYKKCDNCRIKRSCIIPLFIFVNMTVMFVFFLSILSLAEMKQSTNFDSFALKRLTPECTPNLCRDGDMNIDHPSSTDHKESSPNVSFSYLIASDTQLDWYQGESAHIGRRNHPPACSSQDTCGSCSKKHGTYTNAQMKRSIEELIKGTETRRAVNNGPVPKTLVINGDLTSYFHRHEFEKYKKIFHDISGLEYFFPSLGNHDYDQQSGASFGGDQWTSPFDCNSRYAVSYVKSAFCGKVPNFKAKERITRYDAKSLAYSWEEGPYHFIQLHYHPTYENARLGISNSLKWLERDLRLATEANLTSIIFVHSVGHFPQHLERMMVENKVAAIFTGHKHRCFGPKCTKLRPQSVQNLGKLETAMDALNTLNNNTKLDPFEDLEKCTVGGSELCGGDVDRQTQTLFTLNHMDDGLVLPKSKLYSDTNITSTEPTGKCFSFGFDLFVNKTDNTMWCKEEVEIDSHFPFPPKYVNSIIIDESEKIPIFWTGSSSFETFALVDFYSDRFVINFMTAGEGIEGRRYVDAHQVPNAVYPHHRRSDLEEVTIYI